MKFILGYVVSFFLLTAISFADDFSYLEKDNNSWLQIYANSLRAQALDDEIKLLENIVKKAIGKNKVELTQLLKLQTSKKKILDELPQSFDTMLEKITTGNEAKEINIVEYLFTNQKSNFAIQTKKLTLLQQDYTRALEHLNNELLLINKQEQKDTAKEYQLKMAIDFFSSAEGLLDHKAEVIKHMKELYAHELKSYERTRLPRIVLNLGILFFIFILFHVVKYFITKRIENEDRLFKIKKILNITFFLILLLVIIVFNINNIIYAATLIGFIAAAITISMKEYLQSIVAWLHLSFGDFIKQGDRILISVNNQQVIGEVIDISPFKVTLYESINNTTSLQLKRAGRVIFIPNNYFVNNYVYNYTHDKMKTIYDLIEFRIAFSADTQKVEEIASEITLENTERYMEVASKQFISLKKRYDMRSRDFRPRIHLVPDATEPCFILYIWYVTPYHQIMEFKSQLSQKIVRRFQEENIKFYVKE
ncbi:mechanosensitive ion channel [Sulfurimonas gotlandica GD1]|uniref:Mechanosensitive ion channel n=1 Tax=Sulfurimonas gotlandica (strain DSM 19862 / JCM 16533 / GD1) TaxID=929558 RepID=B6BHI4_SULGG|nr:mechanosensitive ion channel domain-containing protein [Sulfurimonas gotlandica]EDZ63706.1 MscS Mechanosensitive ion channel [Sulfurimonas gotlandica GD1]EHP29981.1 mechanosensitive ion channel [Sulfurimonas gotlandica GD1]